MSDATGFAVLAGIFVCAAGFAIWNARLRSAARRRLTALGFAPCPGETVALAACLREIDAALGGAPRELSLSHCARRTAGWGFVHHCDVQDVTPGRDSVSERAHVGAAWSIYLLDLPEPAALHSAAVALYLAPSASRAMRELLRSAIARAKPGAELEPGSHPWSRDILAAFGAAPGKLDAIVPPAVQEKLARAAAHGFFEVHLARGKAVFAVLPGRRDVDREWGYLAEWS